MSVILIYAINLCITVGIMTFIFAVIFKVLPDAEIKWKDVSIGAVATMVTFGDEIKPTDYAITVRKVEEEKGKMSIQQKEKISRKK